MGAPTVNDLVIPVRLADGRLSAFIMKRGKDVNDLIVPIRLADGRLMAAKVVQIKDVGEQGFPVRLADGRLILVKSTVPLMCCVNQYAFYDWTAEEWDGPRYFYDGADSCTCAWTDVLSCGEGGSTSSWMQYNSGSCGGCCDSWLGQPNVGAPNSIYHRTGCSPIGDCDSCYYSNNLPDTLPYDGAAPPDSDFYVFYETGICQMSWTPSGGYVIDIFNCRERYFCWPGKGTVNWDLYFCYQVEGVTVYAVWMHGGGTASAMVTKAQWDANPHVCDSSMFTISHPAVPDPGSCMEG